jgi:hypothetical protein
MSFGRILKRALLYVALAFACLAGIALLLWVGIATGTSGAIEVWSAPIYWTGFLCFITLSIFKEDWHRRTFWLVLAGLISAQVLILGQTVPRLPHLRGAAYMLAVLVEVIVWAILIEGVLALRHGSRESRRHRVRAVHPE